MKASIALAGLTLPVRIGWTEEERRSPQPIRFDVTVALPAPPAALRSDRLEDTVDYGALARAIGEVATGAEYRLLERLAAVAREAIGPFLPAGSRVTLGVTKVAPPIPGLGGGATVVLEDAP